MMLTGAFVAAVAGESSGSAAMGALAAAGAGIVVAALFAGCALVWGTDQILVGAAINLIALGGTGVVYRALYGTTGAALILPTLPAVSGGLDWLPGVGPILATQNGLVYFALALVPALSILFARTGLGLRLRAIGDHPRAAASLGYPVRSYKIGALLCAGALSGLAGATLTLAATNTFVEGITAGRGFVALAVVVFGRWSPWGVLAGALLFGLASALQFQIQAASLAMPHQVALMLPYLVTLAVLVGSRGAAVAPRALGAADDAR
jgi:simple sugar transport system permease protein